MKEKWYCYNRRRYWRLFQRLISTVKDGNFKLISYNIENHLGNIYKYVTLLLGMKPAHHEYKVMGLHLMLQSMK